MKQTKPRLRKRASALKPVGRPFRRRATALRPIHRTPASIA
jgi:hypothetical protein